MALGWSPWGAATYLLIFPLLLRPGPVSASRGQRPALLDLRIPEAPLQLHQSPGHVVGTQLFAECKVVRKHQPHHHPPSQPRVVSGLVPLPHRKSPISLWLFSRSLTSLEEGHVRWRAPASFPQRSGVRTSRTRAAHHISAHSLECASGCPRQPAGSDPASWGQILPID